jgi:hypothetical protein
MLPEALKNGSFRQRHPFMDQGAEYLLLDLFVLLPSSLGPAGYQALANEDREQHRRETRAVAQPRGPIPRVP